jgi:hypothetical protein
VSGDSQEVAVSDFTDATLDMAEWAYSTSGTDEMVLVDHFPVGFDLGALVALRLLAGSGLYEHDENGELVPIQGEAGVERLERIVTKAWERRRQQLRRDPDDEGGVS